MSDNDDEKLPVLRKGDTAPVPAKRDAQQMVPKVGGVVDAALTGWRASAAAKTYRNIGDALDATKGAVSSGIDLKRELDRLGDLDNILDEDQAQRDHARWEADRARKAARVQADYDDQLRVHRNEAELSQAKDQALFHQRRYEAEVEAKPDRIKSTVHKVGAETHAREVKHLTAQEAARRRREQLAGVGAAPTTNAPHPDLIQMVDRELQNAYQLHEPLQVIMRLAALKSATTDTETFIAALELNTAQSLAAGEPYEVVQRLAAMRAVFEAT